MQNLDKKLEGKKANEYVEVTRALPNRMVRAQKTTCTQASTKINI
jgi:hypothetical protein